MHTPFNPEQVNWDVFLSASEGNGDSPHQVGSGYATFDGFIQRGGGVSSGYTYFEGIPYQRGAGVGSVFRSLFRVLMPLGKQALSAVGREGMATAARVLNNALQSDSAPTMGWRDNITSEARTGVGNLLNQAASHLRQQKGSGGRRSKPIKAAANRTIKFPNTTALFSRTGPSSGQKTSKRRNTRVDSLGVY